MRFRSFQNLNFSQAVQFTIYFSVLVCAVLYGFDPAKPARSGQNEKAAALENALFTRAEFFGAEAIVPFPTEQARERLAEVLQNYPNDPEILLKLAELDEKLGRFDGAETAIKAVQPANLKALADFYGRRAQFEKQAEILDRILQNAPPEERAAAFSSLIYLAKKHALKKYLAPEFYQQAIARDDASQTIFFEFIAKLVEEKNYPEALKLIDETSAKFPASKNYLLDRKISILTLQGREKEAEKVYTEAFNPFWTRAESRKFYDFLQENDRFRAYESELRQKFRQNPADFQTALRLIHFRQNDYEEFSEIVQNLENTRAARRIAWQPDELLTISRFLIEAGDGDRASRFLYTLCTNFKVENETGLRRRVLYQLFELLSDAGSEKLTLTRGNLDFFETVAKSDMHPGIATGILSLIFSDTNPREKFEVRQTAAVKLFNRAAAYRIFQEFKKDYPDAPELAQMYLDLIRLYTASKQLEIAGQALAEFEQKYTDFRDFPDAALKLSDAYIAAKKFEKEREIYQKLLDFLGKSDRPKFPPDASFNLTERTDPTQERPPVSPTPPSTNEGINISTAPKTDDDYYRSERPQIYRDHLSTGRVEISYADVLSRYVGALARENKIQEILDLYADETAKYPSEQRLYEQMLQWLGQTNLADRQFEVYQQALRNFQQKTWKDRFARWLIRNKRNDDFENFSRALVSSFDDAETQDYLKQFVDGRETADPKSFDGKLFLALYSLAHERFPHNIGFVRGLLRYYRQNRMEPLSRRLLAEYYFESPEIRREFLEHLAKIGEIRAHLQKSEELSAKNEIAALPYKLFRADASAWVSDFEKSAVFYRELTGLYPNDPEFSENFLTISRSFGQTNRNLLREAATFAQNQAESFPADESFRTRAGELQAELGDYQKARENWQKIVAASAGENESYLNSATVFWDYFQFDDALVTIRSLREKSGDENLYAFQTGAILEAKNDKLAAVDEYLKALDENESVADQWQAKRRLKQLFQKPEVAKTINSAFESRRKSVKNVFRMTFNYADMLFQMNRQPAAVETLLAQVERETSTENLLEARRFFRDLDEAAAVRTTLVRLVRIAENPRDAIAYRFQLAENLRENFGPEKSAAVLAGLVKKFPTNYGVLKETENFYWDLGKREKSVEVLQTARKKARGEYLYQFSRKLAQRLNLLNRTAEAEQILIGLQTDNPNDSDVFSELTDIYVRTNKAENLRKTLATTLDGLKKQDLEPREFRWKAEDLRKKMIAAFTRLKDYDSATEQYIEIINREPENEETLEAAIGFAKRYGGAGKLLEYYEKTAREAFKNYRWNVVLARIYEAHGDFPKAAENYRTAIFNQPEMTELYESLGEIYVKMQNYEAALKNIDKLLELSADDKKYVKQKAQILERLGRKAEAEAEKAKLPAEDRPTPAALPDQFAEAQNLRRVETEKALEKYRQAFENLAADPYRIPLRSADITGFVQTVHAADSLDSIAEKLWRLRAQLAAEIEDPDSVKSGKARENLQILDGAMTEAIGLEIKTKAGGNEILAVRRDLETRLETTDKADVRTLALLQNLIFRCGFEDLQEKGLIRRFENSAGEENRTQSLRTLVAFYQKRDNHRRILEILEKDLADNPLEFVRTYAETARVLEIPEKEVSALRIIFAKQNENDGFTGRYLETLAENNRPELENLARNPGAHELQIINFLFSKKEPELAKEAIANSSYPLGWKLSRIAQTNLKFNNFAAENESKFTAALQLATIGELVKQKPDERSQLTGSEWFNFSNQYGKWLFAAAQPEKAENFLAAGIENHPKTADRQFELGFFYLRQKEFSRALEHFNLARELRPDDNSYLPFIGAAYFQLNEKEKAFETWAKIIEGAAATRENARLYLKTLADFGQAEKARNEIKPIFSKQVKSLKDDPTAERDFIRDLAKTFPDESSKTAFFLEVCRAVPDDLSLPQMLIDESLIAKKDFGEFYEILIERAEGFDNYEHDYKFVTLLEANWDAAEAELLYDSENDFEIEEPKNERLEWQKKYLEFLLENRNFAASAKLIDEIENSLKGHYPRPLWLRRADFRTALDQTKPAFVLSKMMKFAGIEISPNTQKATLPNPERLTAAVEILKSENRRDLVIALQEAFFARQIALGQNSSANFAGLARIEFEKENAPDALRLLEIMTRLPAEEAQAEIDSWPLITKFSNRERLVIPALNTLSQPQSLKFAAEILAELGFFREAAVYREKLREVSPDDLINRIELARLYADLKTADDSARILLEIVADKNVDRKSRWQSLIVLAEIGGNDEGFWQRVVAENRFFEQQDIEIWTALNALSQTQTGRVEAAIELLSENNFTAPLKFLKAVVEKNAGRDERALADFTEISEAGAEIEDIFGFYEAAPRFQIINLYLKSGKLRAALDLARRSELSKSNSTSDFPPGPALKFKTLEIRVRESKTEAKLTLLEKLSAAAETIGELSLAIEFEKARSGLFSSPEAAEASELRVKNLERKILEKTADRENYPVVTEKIAADF
jgi:cellulose synthase operon protein C